MISSLSRRNTGISGREPGSTSGSLHGVGDLFTALRRQELIADELVLQLATFLRSLDLFLDRAVDDIALEDDTFVLEVGHEAIEVLDLEQDRAAGGVAWLYPW